MFLRILIEFVYDRTFTVDVIGSSPVGPTLSSLRRLNQTGPASSVGRIGSTCEIAEIPLLWGRPGIYCNGDPGPWTYVTFP